MYKSNLDRKNNRDFTTQHFSIYDYGKSILLQIIFVASNSNVYYIIINFISLIIIIVLTTITYAYCSNENKKGCFFVTVFIYFLTFYFEK